MGGRITSDLFYWDEESPDFKERRASEWEGCEFF